jgi:hypothetical protein
MLGFIKKLFGSKPVESTAEVPYKVEVAVVPPSTTVTPEFPVESAKKSPANKKPAGAKKPAVQAKTARAKKK